MKSLCDEDLIEAYLKAVSSNLSKDFIQLLKREISQRNLDIELNDE
nr:sporulation histidine kinase inhibitor Sda [Aquibacillus kalidii]